jgi:hypothetical protein
MGEATIQLSRVRFQLGAVCRAANHCGLDVEYRVVANQERNLRRKNMTPRWWHILIILAIGYALGYWMPAIGNMTLGRIYARG